jgi:hypothetical protein
LVCPFLILKRNIESNGSGIVEPFSKKQKRPVALCWNLEVLIHIFLAPRNLIVARFVDQVQYCNVVCAPNRDAIQQIVAWFAWVWSTIEVFILLFFREIQERILSKQKDGTFRVKGYGFSIFGRNSWIVKHFTNTLDSKISLGKGSKIFLYCFCLGIIMGLSVLNNR